MGEYKTKKERIQEQEMKIHDLRMRKLFMLDYLEQETVKLIDRLGKLDETLLDVQKKLIDGDMDAKHAYAIIATIGTRKSIIDGWKMALKEMRMNTNFLGKEEAKLQFEIVKAGQED